VLVCLPFGTDGLLFCMETVAKLIIVGRVIVGLNAENSSQYAVGMLSSTTVETYGQISTFTPKLLDLLITNNIKPHSLIHNKFVSLIRQIHY